ncbi:MAG: SUF system NifU family Fe-S cluster assembly protein [Dehalococcoidia bacterium]|nr:SUF system NifU family Fe-S cluster assembly protein [Dehalococcoidia bacterium]
MSSLPDNPDALYGDVIMDHYRNPRHRTRLSSPDAEAEEFNPFCGDRAALQFALAEPGRNDAPIAAVSALAEGCSIIQASASLLAEGVQGRTVEQAADLSQLFRDLMQGKPLPPVALAELGDLEALEVVRQYPVRIKCVLLPWVALEEGLRRLGGT